MGSVSGRQVSLEGVFYGVDAIHPCLKKMKQLMADVTGSDDKGVGVGDG